MKKLLSATAALAALALLSLPAQAREASAGNNPTMNFDNFYAGVDVGVVIPNASSAKFAGALVGSANLNFDSAAAGGAFVGYHINQYVAGEANLDYTSLGMHDLSGTVAGIGTGSIGVDGSVGLTLGTVNAIITPIGRKSAFTPYFGGGIGFASSNENISSMTFGGVTTATPYSHSETDWAEDATIGFDYAVADNVSLGARYRYIWINDGGTSTSNGVTETDGNDSAQMLTAEAVYHF